MKEWLQEAISASRALLVLLLVLLIAAACYGALWYVGRAVLRVLVP